MDLLQKRGTIARAIYVTAGIIASFWSMMSCQENRSYRVEKKDAVRIVHNLNPKFEKPAARLKIIQQIGELEPEDENYLFSSPLGVAEDGYGNIFILDSQECCVKKFSPDGDYLFEFGRPGQGPGELEYPMTIDCHGDRLLVITMAPQIHIFDLKGKYLESFRLPRYKGFDLKFLNDKSVVGYAMLPGGENTKENKVLNIHDLQGNLLFEFGEPFLVGSAKSSWVANMLRIAVDDQSGIYVAFIFQNRIEKYSSTGILQMKIDRELPFDLDYRYEKKKIEIRGEAREYMGEDFPRVSRGIGVDHMGRIWVLVLIKIIPKDTDMENFDNREYFKFQVYGEGGILLYTVPFPTEIERFDNWTMKKNHIFFADPVGQACVYEYEIIG